jgi:hypothetical protein
LSELIVRKNKAKGQEKRPSMITDSNQACLAKIVGRSLQEESVTCFENHPQGQIGVSLNALIRRRVDPLRLIRPTAAEFVTNGSIIEKTYPSENLP